MNMHPHVISNKLRVIVNIYYLSTLTEIDLIYHVKKFRIPPPPHQPRTKILRK